VLVAEEEHDGARVVELVHGVEIGDLYLLDTAHATNGLRERQTWSMSQR
jgi:hypothetical protein